MERALKHHLIALRSGYPYSLERIQELYYNGQATKEDFKKASQAYREYVAEIKSDQRDKAAATDEKYRYYVSFNIEISELNPIL